MAAIEVADLVVTAFAQLLAGQFGVDALARQGRGHAVQGGVGFAVLDLVQGCNFQLAILGKQAEQGTGANAV